MPLKLVCPKCEADLHLVEPLPQPGDEVQCFACGCALSVTYPDGVIEALRRRGKAFAAPRPGAPGIMREEIPQLEVDAQAYGVPSTVMGTTPSRAARARPPVAPPPPPPGPRITDEPPTEVFEGGAPATDALTELDSSSTNPTSHPTTVDATEIGEGSPTPSGEFDRTVASARSPHGGLPSNAAEPEGRLATLPSTGDEPASASTAAGTDIQPPRASMKKSTPKKRRGLRAAFGCVGSMGVFAALGTVAAVVLGLLVAGGGYLYYSHGLPSIDELRTYRPATVTVVEDRNGVVLGEIFEQRRYVVPVEDIPEHVKHAFLAAEDANFFNHGGVDFMGIVRAMGRNALAGRMAQGASTITQQVAKNFLLTNDKKLERKIKEVILSWRIEDAYTKDHILYLYLNEIFLGSQAYGVEAASRAYFGKHVREITIAEAAILAGLPQRPSDYSPHRNWDKARVRQEYVVGQMKNKGYITAAEAEAALIEQITVVPRGNAFLEQAPYFTEHVRRYLVDTYGADKVLNEGLLVRTTCDMDLQNVAQDSVTQRVAEVDQRMGFRRSGITNVGKGNIDATRTAQETKLKDAWAAKQDPAGRIDVPETSILEPGKFYEGVLTEVKPGWAKVAIGAHDGLIPIEWSRWVYEPNPKRSWRNRRATDLTKQVDTDDDRKADTPILMAGDVVQVRVDALSTRDPQVSKAFLKTPGESSELVAVRLWQDNVVEAGLLSMDVESGAIRAMVGGADFRKSQFNRAIQARRQVGSTFKPIVYAAAIESERVTAGTLVADAPLAFATSEDFIWKPSNYSHEYEGLMTLRQALAKSKNTCTVRVLEAADPGMNDDVVYNLARRLGIGGPPLQTLPEDHVATPDNDVLCPWVRETKRSTICMDRYPAIDPEITNTAHRATLTDDDVYWCRACDMSMGLGSASLTMEEMIRAYSPFATSGRLVEPYTIEEVRDRDGTVLEKHETPEFEQVIDPAVASITRWLMEGVVRYGTGFQASKALKLRGLAGKTGTTNDEKDAWFVGYTPNVITAAWVGFDQPASLGVSSTGGRTALPIWIDYMRVAAPKEDDREFRMVGDLDYAGIDEKTGRRVSGGGMRYPFLKGTAPEGSGLEAGQVSIEDLGSEL